MDRLAEYRRRRRFGVTTEPRGSRRTRRSGDSFVVQKHAARRLHYDFRLELNGVLKSWAVPKGPSLDPAEKRLAVETEDHPLEYGGFEGIIPEGEYGAGGVIVWDRGTWEPVGDAARDYAAGKLKFHLHGEKLVGGWTLVRIRNRDSRDAARSWLLMKERDEAARPGSDVAAERPESALTGRDLSAVARNPDRVWHSNRPVAADAKSRGRTAATPRKPAVRPPDAAAVPGARRGRLPARIALQLATLVSAPPSGDGWLHEMKYDGYRIACRLERGRAKLYSRNGADWTERFASVARALARLAATSALVDGEVAVLLPDGTTSFNALQNALSADRSVELVYFAFDLLHLDGYDLTPSSLETRKAALRQLLDASDTGGVCRYSDHVLGDGAVFFREACRHALEGIVSKERDAPYVPGRGRSWQKTKCVREQELVIGGFTDPTGRRAGLGALLVGVYDGDRLVYAGKVGTGFTEAAARELRKRLEALEVREPPFAERPRGMAHAHWVRPELVTEVAFTEWTPDGRLRHPSFKGLREDKPAREIVREEPSRPTARAARRHGTPVPRKGPRRPDAKRSSAVTAHVAGVELTHADRVLYPALGTTKLALARFYESIAEWILPHVRGRPTTLVRCPEGLAGSCFYQKHTGYWAPPALRRIRIQEQRKIGEYLVVDDLAGLVGLVQIGILEIHTWNSVAERLEQPDRLVFDLDPGEGLPWRAVVEAARVVRRRLQDRGLESFVKTTGGKGLHVVAPIVPGPDWDACAAFARDVASGLARELPQVFTATMAKSERTGRIFLDWLRNVRGATAVAAYSTRARPEAPVSTPLAWDELAAGRDSRFYTIRNLPRRLRTLGADPWAGSAELRQRLPRARPAR